MWGYDITETYSFTDNSYQGMLIFEDDFDEND